MDAVPQRDVLKAAGALAGVAVLGLVVGVLQAPGLSDDPFAGRHGGENTVPMAPGMASPIDAKPLAPDALPPSSAPAPRVAALAESDSEADDGGDNAAGSDSPAPPQLYAPPEPAPAAPQSKPAGDDSNLPPF